jgi:uncharacterized membrane protein YagU involved in acid resistance
MGLKRSAIILEIPFNHSSKMTDRAMQNGKRRTSRARLYFALLSGVVAIGANMALLGTASAAGITTAHGGLLRLLEKIVHHLAPLLHVVAQTNQWSMLAVSAVWFQNAFHVITGLFMAIVYSYILDQRLYGRPLVKGLLYGTAVWLFNAFVVLPLIGEGIAGSAHLNAIGMISFAFAHMAFFEVLSVIHGCLSEAKIQQR